MKAALIVMVSMMLGLGMSTVRAADSHQHGKAGANAKTEKMESMGGGKTCEKCNKHKGAGAGEKMGGMNGCCCGGMMGKGGMDGMMGKGNMMSSEQHGGMESAAMMERMQKMEERMDAMQKMMMEQKGKS